MKTIHALTNFTSGELSPRARGRVDIPQFAGSARQLRNAYPLITGGAISRPGTTLSVFGDILGTQRRLVPFLLRKNDNYVLVFGDNTLRVIKNGNAVTITGGVSGALATPYSGAALFEIDFTQDASTMYIAHEKYPIQRLRRYSDTDWAWDVAPFTAEPFEEIGDRFTASGTLSAATVGSGRTFTKVGSGDSFTTNDIGRAILYQGGVFVVTGFTNADTLVGTITSPFPVTSIPVGQWTLDASPQTTLTPSATGPVGATITLTTPSPTWRLHHSVGTHIAINGGLVKITALGSSVQLIGVVVTELSSTAASPALAWQLKRSVWNTLDGYPRTVTLHQQRLVAAGSPGYPQTIWGSRIAEPLDFTVLVNDSAGYSFTIGSDENNQIAYLASGRHLMALTFGAEYSLRGQNAKTIISTLNPPDIVPESNYGTAGVRPETVQKDLMFVQRAGKAVRSLGYRYEFDGYDSPDMSVLADHLFGKLDDGTSLSVIDMTYQQRPHSLLWCLRSDGKLLSMTIDKGQNVIGWALHDVGGLVESITCIPGADSDVLYLVVRRQIDNQTRRYVERMEMTTQSARLSERGLMQMDCGSFYQSSTPLAAISAFYLPNTALDLLIDGTYGGRVISGGAIALGAITLPRSGTTIAAGIPFTTTIEPNAPEDSQQGYAIGQRMSTSRAIVRLLESGPVRVNGQLLDQVPPQTLVAGVPTALFTGDLPISELGWDDGKSPVVIVREQPFPVHVLAVIRDLTVNVG